MKKELSADTIQQLAAIVSYFDRFSVDDLKKGEIHDAKDLEFLSVAGVEEAISEIYGKISKKGYTPYDDCNVQYRSKDE